MNLSRKNILLCCCFLIIRCWWTEHKSRDISEINIPQSVCVFLSASTACSVNYVSDSDFEGGWSEPGVDG